MRSALVSSPRVAATTAARIVAGGVMPSVCFIAGRHSFGLPGAVGLSLIWAAGYQVTLHRRAGRWSVLVTMNLAELVIRSTVALCLGSTTVFFVLPSVLTACFGATYLVSCVAGRPLLALIAHELLPSPCEGSGSGRATLTLRWASIAYGLEQILVGGLSILLALQVSPSAYVTVHPPLSWSVFGLGMLGFTLFCRRRLPKVAPDPASLALEPVQLTPTPMEQSRRMPMGPSKPLTSAERTT